MTRMFLRVSLVALCVAMTGAAFANSWTYTPASGDDVGTITDGKWVIKAYEMDAAAHTLCLGQPATTFRTAARQYLTLGGPNDGPRGIILYLH